MFKIKSKKKILKLIFIKLNSSNIFLNYNCNLYVQLPYTVRWVLYNKIVEIIFETNITEGFNRYALGCVFVTLLNIKEFYQLGEIKVTMLYVSDNLEIRILGLQLMKK